jgi:hypothetical protein
MCTLYLDSFPGWFCRYRCAFRGVGPARLNATWGKKSTVSISRKIILDRGARVVGMVSDVINLTHINKLMSSAGMGLIGRIAA